MDDFASNLVSLGPLPVSIEANSSDTSHGSFDQSSLVGKSGPDGAGVMTRNASKRALPMFQTSASKLGRVYDP